MAESSFNGRSHSENKYIRIVVAEAFVPGWRENRTVSNQKGCSWGEGTDHPYACLYQQLSGPKLYIQTMI